MPNRKNLYIITGTSKKNFTKQMHPFGLKNLQNKSAFVGSKLKINVKMHGEHNVKLINARQANLYIITGASKKNFTKQTHPFVLTKSVKYKVYSLVQKLKEKKKSNITL
jgi:hypothetical protein